MGKFDMVVVVEQEASELWVMGYDRFYGFYLTITCLPSQ